MKETNLFKKASVLTLAFAMTCSMFPFTTFAADDVPLGQTDSSVTNHSANNDRDAGRSRSDQGDADTIDVNKKGSIHIYKYDTTSAEAAGKYHEGDIKATGQQDTAVSDALSDFKIEGVEFTYLKVGDIETYSDTSTDTPGSNVVVVYEIPTKLQEILNRTDKLPATGNSPADGGNGPYDMTKSTVANPCSKAGVLHYDSTQLSDALADILSSDDIITKNALESYLLNYATESTDTDDTTANDAAASDATTGKLVTNADGEASVSDLPLGLYLIVETRVPEEVTETVSPWLVTLPFTNTYVQSGDQLVQGKPDSASSTSHTDNGVDSTDNNGGDYWLYDFYSYPKNQTGNPTFDKSVRNSYSAVPATNSANGHKNDKVNTNDTAVSTYDSTISTTDELRHATGLGGGTNVQQAAFQNSTNPIIVFNEKDGEHQADTDAKEYVANRGGYTKGDNTVAGSGGANYSKDFAYGDVTTASEGDVLDYILVTKLPHITSKATYLSKYTFTDILSRGLTFNNDPQIAFYTNKADAEANNTKNAIMTWTYNQDTRKFGKNYATLNTSDDGDGTNNIDGCTRMIITMTEDGLKQINHEPDKSHLTIETPEVADAVNRGLSDYYMVVYYTATVESNDQVLMGDQGNTNDAALVWSRTNNKYDNSLQDRNYVYTYGIDLTKQFSKSADNDKFRDVEFKLYNNTDAYYVRAVEDPENSGIYYVTGKAHDKKDGTTFIPSNENGSKGKLLIRGLEADQYDLTEVKTTDGYTLLKDQIVIDITPTERDIKASVAGTVGLTADNSAAIIENYGTGIKNEDGQLVNAMRTDVPEDASVNREVAAGGSSQGTFGENGYKPDNSGGGTTVNGRTIGKTDMYVGEIKKASATVDGKTCKMKDSSTGTPIDNSITKSENAEVVMSVLNQKNWTLPQTGGAGLYLITILGILMFAGGVAMNKKKKTA